MKKKVLIFLIFFQISCGVKTKLRPYSEGPEPEEPELFEKPQDTWIPEEKKEVDEE